MRVLNWENKFLSINNNDRDIVLYIKYRGYGWRGRRIAYAATKLSIIILNIIIVVFKR